MPKISVCIGTYNQRDVLERVLTSYLDQTLPNHDYEIVIVDSTSTDGTPDMVKGFEGRLPVRLIVQPNTGKASARNRAAAESKSPTLYFTDGDLLVHPDLLQAHVKAQETAPSPRLYQGLEYNMDTLHWPPNPAKLRPIVPKRYQSHQKIGWYYCLTGNLSLPKAEFDSVGGFSEDFTGYGFEDIECGYRLHLKGIDVYFLKSAINYHWHLITPELEVSRADKKGMSAALFYTKHPKLKWYLGLNPVSTWIHSKISPDGWWIRFLNKRHQAGKGQWGYRFSSWFLHEYHYITGAKLALATGQFQ